MSKSRRLTKIVTVGLAVILAAVAVGYYKIKDKALAGSGYNAKILCSSVFVSGRNPADVERVDLGATAFIPFSNHIDRTNQTASSSLFGLFKQTAVYREGLGCTLAVEISEKDLASQVEAVPRAESSLDASMPWPEGKMVEKDNLPAEVDSEKLKKAIEFAFTDPDPANPIRTRAVVAVYNGRIIAEKYADGFSKDTRLLGWSMTKSVTNAMVGILVKQGRYGAHFWLNAGTSGRPEDRDFPSLPTDLFYMSGHDGQMVAIIPGSRLVIVRLGYTPASVTTWDKETFLGNFIDAIHS